MSTSAESFRLAIYWSLPVIDARLELWSCGVYPDSSTRSLRPNARRCSSILRHTGRPRAVCHSPSANRSVPPIAPLYRPRAAFGVASCSVVAAMLRCSSSAIERPVVTPPSAASAPLVNTPTQLFADHSIPTAHTPLIRRR
ncbi:hypothetical protein C8R44DRAFT_874361 [Mycena epipterygia]|nr:hypothetical protein C8R44DRAFT_874361 [Mycena epipterygia]